MLRYLCFIVCACAVGQVVAYSRPAVLQTSPLAANRLELQPALTVEYLLSAPSLAYGASSPVLAPYGAPALAPVLNRVAGPISYVQPAPAPVLYASPAPAPLPVPVPIYGAPAPGPRAPAVDSESIALARLALSLPTAGGPIVDPIPIVPSGPVKPY